MLAKLSFCPDGTFALRDLLRKHLEHFKNLLPGTGVPERPQHPHACADDSPDESIAHRQRTSPCLAARTSPDAFHHLIGKHLEPFRNLFLKLRYRNVPNFLITAPMTLLRNQLHTVNELANAFDNCRQMTMSLTFPSASSKSCHRCGRECQKQRRL